MTDKICQKCGVKITSGYIFKERTGELICLDCFNSEQEIENDSNRDYPKEDPFKGTINKRNKERD